jgi:hypothetical protein
MQDRKDPKNRPREVPGCTPPEGEIRDQSQDWEARALARVRPHVRDLAGPAAAQAGWETDTITRLEDYFDRGEV